MDRGNQFPNVAHFCALVWYSPLQHEHVSGKVFQGHRPKKLRGNICREYAGLRIKGNPVSASLSVLAIDIC
eukprot:3762862-Amphidinium_carterae.2